jgi:small subunit ribosomal protein S4
MVRGRQKRGEDKMAKKLEKCKLCRRERTKLFLKGARCFSPKCPIEKKGGVPPGEHGMRSGVRPSAYAKQLREKQKIKRTFGVTEKQFRNYLIQAERKKENTSEEFLCFLEMRLDNVVHRLGLAPSRATSRQLISHGHVQVNGQKLTIPSYQVKVGDEISLSNTARKMDKVKSWVERKEEVPAWLEKKGFIGKIKKKPSREQMIADVDESLVIEFYSR